MDLNSYLREERGRTKQLAAKLGVSDSLVTQWASGKAVSAERCYPIELATACLVRRWDLRPSDWHRIWPELIGAKGSPSLQRSLGDLGAGGPPHAAAADELEPQLDAQP
jgi:DNA-binding transcriptional regulator YdaS (Cro superfamily)